MTQVRFTSIESSSLQNPKVFIGTMCSGEGDFDECMRAINKQEHVNITHCVISNLPEKQAHNMLWSAWNGAKQEHSLFIKVDADTVLRESTTVARIHDLMIRPDVTGIQCPIHDYFCDDLINGLNCFDPVVQFQTTIDNLYCDRVDQGHRTVLRRESLPPELVPAAYHCHHATEEHAFHYGLHRMLKNQRSLIAQVKTAWQRHNHDRLRGMALLGASQAQEFLNGEFNYTDQRFKDAYVNAAQNYDELITRI